NLLSGLYVVHNERTAQVAISDDLVLLKAFLGVIPVSEHIDNALTGPVALLPKSPNVVIDLRVHKQRNVRPKVITELVVVRDNLTLVRARLNLKSYVYSTSKFNLITTRERGCNKTLDTANVVLFKKILSLLEVFRDNYSETGKHFCLGSITYRKVLKRLRNYVILS